MTKFLIQVYHRDFFRKVNILRNTEVSGQKHFKNILSQNLGNFRENACRGVFIIKRSTNFQNILELHFDVCHIFCSISRQLNVFYTGILKIHGK